MPPEEGAAPATTAAPAPPAPAAPTLSPIQQAVAEARERLASGQTLTGTPGTPAAEAPAGEAPPVVPGEAPPPAAGETPPVDGEAPPADGETPPADGEQPAGDDENILRVELPGRGPDDPPFIINAEDKETAERLRQLRNGFMRGEEVRAMEARNRADREALMDIEARLESDTEGFLFERIPKERAASVAFQILLQDDVWAEVAPALRELADNDEKRELVRTRLENDRLKRKDDVAKELVERRSMAENAQQVRQAVALCIPSQLPPERQVELFNAFLTDIGNYAEEVGLKKLDPRHVPVVLAERLRMAGIDPVEAASRLANRDPRARQGTEAVGSAPRIVKRAAAPTPPTGPALVAAAQAQRTAAGTPPAGAGTPNAGTVTAPPKGQTIQERIDWYRAQKGLQQTNPV